ncbi:hypothetical protein CHS0354_008929 [Potamilus streckersoni]|uniref:Uncharacterized protein n=1 Tax=Potamilus streckersoni TaxID=2493646 RepID=A0AAE0WEC8_9BIVA|nr:hypothetical protein CHS0354_008929 [Potamilus streckersoni]
MGGEDWIEKKLFWSGGYSPQSNPVPVKVYVSYPFLTPYWEFAQVFRLMRNGGAISNPCYQLDIAGRLVVGLTLLRICITTTRELVNLGANETPPKVGVVEYEAGTGELGIQTPPREYSKFHSVTPRVF